MDSFIFNRKFLHNITAIAFIILLSFSCTDKSTESSDKVLSVGGAVRRSRDYTLSELKALPSFFLKDVFLVHEKDGCADDESLESVASYRGVLLRDLLLEAGMRHERKYEPGVFFRVRNGEEEVIFSFGEMFYSSIGRSTIIAYQKDGKSIDFGSGAGQLIIHTDLRAGRSLKGVTEIIVERVDVEMKVYDDQKSGYSRPPSENFILIDKQKDTSRTITLADLKSLSPVSIPHALMAGDCEGFGGIYSFEGTPLRHLLEYVGIDDCHYDYNRYVLIESEDGFCATFSFGELFNSRLSDNIIIAYTKSDFPLDDEDGFAMSVVREDSTGGRSVKRIDKITIF